jgi:hypothetical protein
MIVETADNSHTSELTMALNNKLSRCEQRRLSLEEDDWRLSVGTAALTRTRGGGVGRPDLKNAAMKRCVIGIDSDSSSSPAATTRSEEEVPLSSPESVEVEPEDAKTSKPSHTRVLVEVSQLEEAFKSRPCPDCGKDLTLDLPTMCLATSLRLFCDNKACSYVREYAKPKGTEIHLHDKGKYERMTDYAVNVLYVLGFITLGDAHTEAARLLGLLGLPNDTTMMNRSFTIIEERIGPFIRGVTEEIIMKNVQEEARLSMSDVDYNVWKTWLDGTSTIVDLPSDRWPQLDASYDMAWQQKGSGRVYNSQSGHGTLFGSKTRKIIGLVIKSKLCCFCNKIAKTYPEGVDFVVPFHHCWRNHNGSSGSMESAGAVELLVEAYDKKKVVIRRLCCDDDSSIRADCKWSNKDYMKNHNIDELPMVPITVGKNKGKLQVRPDKGKLPRHVPEPLFVADPNHRRKGLTGELISLDASKVDTKLTMTRMDSIRIGKNFGYMARTLTRRPEEEYVDAAKACLEHHFDNHEYCGDWCKRKHETEEERNKLIKYYRCKDKDAKLYALLASKIDRFVTHERLVEMAHDLDTNMNEAFNAICTWFAPKNKVFAGSGSLANRISVAVGIHSLGVEMFFRRLFKSMGIALSDNVAYYLNTREKRRCKRLEFIRTKAAKLKKNKRKYDKLKEATSQAKKEFHRRQGTYRKGMNMDDPFGEDNDPDGSTKPPARKKAKAFCEYCGRSDHLTRKSKKCNAPLEPVKKYRKEDGTLLTEAPAAPVVDPSDINLLDCHNMDRFTFDTEYDSSDENLVLVTMDDLEDNSNSANTTGKTHGLL